MRLISWNVNGIRASVKKGFMDRLREFETDVLCVQETKAQDDQVYEAIDGLQEYYCDCNSAVKKGYSGTAIFSRTKPASILKDMGVEEHDSEGRITCAEYEEFYVVNVYVPNSGQELHRLDYRSSWDRDFLSYLKKLEESKPVILCGDLNVAHRPIDIARPDSNYNKTAGYTQVEIDGLDAFFKAGFVDTFRALNPEKVQYSWWSWRAGARDNNIGWRIDYFLVSPQLLPRIKSAFIWDQVEGSDHCPVGIDIE